MITKSKNEMSEAELDLRHAKKMAKKKAARDKILSSKILEKGLLIVHTGKGKGNSTAAMGRAMRAIGNGMKVGIGQFVKGVWETGERVVLDKFPELCVIKAMGEGFSWETQDRQRDIQAAENAWQMAKDMMDDESFGLNILDELNIPLRYDNLDIDDVGGYGRAGAAGGDAGAGDDGAAGIVLLGGQFLYAQGCAPIGAAGYALVKRNAVDIRLPQLGGAGDELALHLCSGLVGGPAGLVGHAAAGGVGGVADRVGIDDLRFDAGDRDAEDFGELLRDRGAGAADVGRALGEADAAVGIECGHRTRWPRAITPVA